MAVHVSIHDVSPTWRAEVEEALSLCQDAGARPALLVVPDFHAGAPIVEDAGFCARLRELQGRGHEIYLHGFFHHSRTDFDPTRHGSRRRWLYAQRVVSAGEAEMSDLTPAEGRALVVRGEAALAAAGLRVDGFVPPAWSRPAWLLPFLAQRGYRFTEDRVRVYDPAGGRQRISVVLNWASRSPARMLSTVAWCRVAKHARLLWPARIAIHPGDMRVLLLRRQIAHLLAWGGGDFVERAADIFEA